MSICAYNRAFLHFCGFSWAIDLTTSSTAGHSLAFLPAHNLYRIKSVLSSSYQSYSWWLPLKCRRGHKRWNEAESHLVSHMKGDFLDALWHLYFIILLLHHISEGNKTFSSTFIWQPSLWVLFLHTVYKVVKISATLTSLLASSLCRILK